MSKPIIEVHGISKKFTIGKSRSGDLRNSMTKLFSFSGQKKQDIWALQDINFQVNAGEILGIIGPNGSGKSTLLKILSRITEPTSGHAIMRGKISSLLEVGTGFHPELSGRENIFLNGSILGLQRKDIVANFDEIVDFSGVRKFIDTPVKHYSSGMYVRLAFSVAAYLNPEILLVDEVLSVGDMAFREKSIEKMKQVAKSGKTILFVSHDLETIESMCNKGILIQNGKIESTGKMKTVIRDYTSKTNKSHNEIDSISIKNGFDISAFTINEQENKNQQLIQSGDKMVLAFNYTNSGNHKNLTFRLEIKNRQAFTLFVCNNFLTGNILSESGKTGEAICTIDKTPLNTGNYLISLTVLSNNVVVFQNNKTCIFEVTRGGFYSTGFMPSNEKLFLVDHHWTLK